MKTLALLCGLALLLALALVLHIRLAPSDPARWHVDPATVPDPATPNFARTEALIALPRAEVAARIAAQALREGAVRLAGDADLVTYVARTRLMRYPDYVSIRLSDENGSTRVQAFSRARFGRGDQGVNAARLQRWVGRLQM